MYSKLGLQLSLVVAGLVGLCSTTANAQAPIKGFAAPLSSAGGYARSELMNIYNDSIGTGYSAGSLNTIALNSARAQQYGNVVTSPNAGAGRRLSLKPGGTTAKPFSSYSPSPTTSPYLNLFREDLGGESDLNYNTLVKPQIQQQQFNQQVQRQGQEISRRMQSMAAQSDFNPQGDKNQFPTGHQTVFGYYGHFHPEKAYAPGKR